MWGFALQFVMAIIVLRWKDGYEAIRWVSEQISTFIEYGYDGAAAIFGDPFLLLHPFVFMVRYARKRPL
jgi:pyrimidine nucleoside transport protein